MGEIIPISQIYKSRSDLSDAFSYLDEGEYLQAWTAYRASLPNADIALLFLEEIMEASYEDFDHEVFLPAYEAYERFGKPIDMAFTERYLQILYQNDEHEQLQKYTKALRKKGSSYWLICDYYDQQIESLVEFAENAEYGHLFDATALQRMIESNFAYGVVDYDFRFDIESLEQSFDEIAALLIADTWSDKEKAILLHVLVEAGIDKEITITKSNGSKTLIPSDLPIIRDLPLFDVIFTIFEQEPVYAAIAQTVLTMYVLAIYPFVEQLFEQELLITMTQQLLYEMNNDMRSKKKELENREKFVNYEENYEEFKKLCFNN